MSLAELMEPPAYLVLTADRMLAANLDEWMLTADAFIKFQVRRQAAEGAGHESMKKNLLKILARIGDAVLADMGALMEETVQYIRHTLWSSDIYVLHATELKETIILNARTVLMDVQATAGTAPKVEEQSLLETHNS